MGKTETTDTNRYWVLQTTFKKSIYASLTPRKKIRDTRLCSNIVLTWISFTRTTPRGEQENGNSDEHNWFHSLQLSGREGEGEQKWWAFLRHPCSEVKTFLSGWLWEIWKITFQIMQVTGLFPLPSKWVEFNSVKHFEACEGDVKLLIMIIMPDLCKFQPFSQHLFKPFFFYKVTSLKNLMK